MNEKRITVKTYFDNGFSPSETAKAVAGLGIKRLFVYRTFKRLRETGSIENRKGSGRPRSARTSDRVKRIREKIRRNPNRSARKMATEEKISIRSMRRILKDDLHLIPYKKRLRHGLSEPQRIARVQKAKALLNRHDSESVKNIIFSDEKLFTTEVKLNPQNDRIYALRIEDIPDYKRTVQTFQNKNSVMVWAAIGWNGKIPLKFVDKGVKINKEYYLNEILISTLSPNVASIYPNGQWTFQQDSAPAHKAKVVQAWLRSNCPDFISTEDWPASSPDLNPLDYCIWGTLEAKVNTTPHRSIESLKRKLIKEWANLPMDLVRASIDCWRRRLSLTVKQKGGRFE